MSDVQAILLVMFILLACLAGLGGGPGAHNGDI